MGDRRFAAVQDHELFFSWHRDRAGDIMEGLEGTHKGGIRYPIPTSLDEAPMPAHYFVEVQDLIVKKKPTKRQRK